MTNEEEYVEETTEETPVVETTTTEEVDWKAKFEEEEGRRRRLETKLNKAKETPAEKPPTSDALDLGAKAFLAANGIKGSKEYDFVQSELKKSGETVDSLIENEYFKAKLEKFRALEQTASATPSGDSRSGGAAIDSVEYWATKPFEEVPKDMQRKVVNYKLEKENSKGVFYNS